jgi:hypothetical protein
MPTRLYCLVAAGSDVAPPADGDVRALAVDGLVAWVSTTDDVAMSREGSRAAQDVLRHDRVVSHAVAHGVTAVPATVADPYPDDDAVVRDIRGRRDEIEDAMNKIEGAVEMAILIAPGAGEQRATADSTVAGAGRQYLERLRQLPTVLGRAADDLDARVGGLSLESRRRTDPDRVSLYHLVRRDRVTDYRRQAVAGMTPDLRIVVDGPRAPYSFAAFSPGRDR